MMRWSVRMHRPLFPHYKGAGTRGPRTDWVRGPVVERMTGIEPA